MITILPYKMQELQKFPKLSTMEGREKLDNFVYFRYYVQHMNNVYISSSELKRNVAEVLNSVYFDKKVAMIRRYGKIVAKIVPVVKEETKDKKLSSILNKYFGILPNFPDVSKARNFRKRSVKL